MLKNYPESTSHFCENIRKWQKICKNLAKNLYENEKMITLPYVYNKKAKTGRKLKQRKTY
jgi:hypothetical protein